jgi:hypothetical protein
MVQGVVVQISTLAPSKRGALAFATGKRTWIVFDLCSWYSTSASASAVFSTGDHSTALAPR